MSLIQDALKRQQEESESIRVPLKATPPAQNAGAVDPTLREVGAAPSVPDVMPVPPSPPAAPATLGIALRAGPEPANRPLPASQRLPAAPPVDPPAIRQLTDVALRAGLEKPVQSGKSWKLIAGIIILCVIIAWSGGLLVVLILKQSAEHTLLGQVMPDLIKAHATQSPATAISKPVVTSAPGPWLSPAAAAAPAFADEGEDVNEDMALPSVKEQGASATWSRRKLSAILGNAGADQEDARLKPVVWPRLKLSAIFSNMGPGQSGARLNNRLILLGDQIEGVTLIEIRRDSVVLKCGKQTRSLKMGMTLN
ncbi:MAG: hypothetical protein NT011_03470 [Kiritimatiellaeota bacterium]|nr:hypothetical protein [Kiritimatiellota bacterium]